MIASIEDRVKAGALFLDKIEQGWAHKIDLIKLEHNNAFYCVLGQLYGSYFNACNTLECSGKLRAMDRFEYGFAYEGYDEILINEAWKKEIRDRISIPQMGYVPT